MSQPNPLNDEVKADQAKKEDSFKLPVEKSPLFMYAFLQIPIVLLMCLGLYFMYQSSKN